MKAIYQNSTAQRVTQDMKIFESRGRAAQSSHRVLSITDLRSLLLDRLSTDRLVKKHIDTFETTYRVLHIPTFIEAYERYRNSD
jgi:hypothetical protein